MEAIRDILKKAFKSQTKTLADLKREILNEESLKKTEEAYK